jgi:hypothetical protein
MTQYRRLIPSKKGQVDVAGEIATVMGVGGAGAVETQHGYSGDQQADFEELARRIESVDRHIDLKIEEVTGRIAATSDRLDQVNDGLVASHASTREEIRAAALDGIGWAAIGVLISIVGLLIGV